MKKYFAYILVALLMLANPSAAWGESSSGDFMDIKGHWAENDIKTSCQRGWMSGLGSDGQGLKYFYPDNTVTRAQLASALSRTFKLDYGSQAFIKAPQVSDYYRDVDNQAWYAEPALLCAVNQIFSPGEYFQPEQQASRIELARAVYRCFNAKGVSIPMIMMMPIYQDTGEISGEDTNVISFVSNTGIMKGDGQNFRPGQAVNRAELARVLAACASLMESNREADKEVNDSYNGKTLNVKVGETFILSLDSNPTTGYDWSISGSGDEKVLALIDKGFASPATTGLMGQGGKSYWKFKALQAGSTDIKLVYARPWESVQPLQTFQLNIQVDPAALTVPSPVKVSGKKVNEEQEYKNVDLNIPVISGMADTEAQAGINLRLEEEALNWKKGVEAGFDDYIKECLESGFPIRAYGVASDYQLCEQNERVLSFYVDYYQYTGGAHGLTERRAYNIDLDTGKALALKDLFREGYNYRAFIDGQINQAINAQPENYFSGDLGFQGIDEEQGYYFQGNNLVVYFDQYEIAPYAAGMPEFQIPLAAFEDGLKLRLN